MALDKNDIELLRQMMREEIAASEQRMTARMTAAIEASELRTHQAMESAIHGSETRVMTYIESHVEKKLDMTIEAVNATNERIDRLTDRVDDLSETALAHTLYIVKGASGKNPPQAQ